MESVNLETLKNKLHNLRIAELKPIIKAMSLSASGRKQELVDRIYDKVASYRTNLALHASQSEAHASFFKQQMAQALAVMNRQIGIRAADFRGQLPPDRISQQYKAAMHVIHPHHGWNSGSMHVPMANPMPYPHVVNQTIVATTIPELGNARCLCGTKPGPSEKTMKCSICPLIVHCKCHGLLVDATEWTCETCRSKLFDPFFKVVQNFGTPHFVRFNTPRLQTVYFDLTPHDLDVLRQYRGTDPGSVELQLRCFVINHTLAEGHEWPATTQVNVNGFAAQITQRAPPGQTNVSKVLRELPLNLGQFCRPGRNTIELRANDTYGYLFAFVIQRVVREALTSLINVVVNNSKNITYESAKQNVIASFGNEDDDIVAMSTLLSVRCPLGLCVIEFPARGIRCQHLQCFDLKTFLTFNKSARSRAWKCTVCNQFIALNDLRIDPFLKDLLSQVADDEELESVEIFPDATWKKRVEEDESKPKKPKLEDTQSNRTVNDALDDFDSPKTAPKTSPVPAPTIESIDLTLSSDEENDDIPLIGLIPPSKPSNPPSNSLWPSSSNSWPNNQNNALPQLGGSLSNQLDFSDFYTMPNDAWPDASPAFNTESEAFTNIRNPIIDVLSSPIPTINPVPYRPLPPISPDRLPRPIPVMAAPAPPIAKATLPAPAGIENTPADTLPISNGCPAVSPPRRFPPVSSFFNRPLAPPKASPPPPQPSAPATTSTAPSAILTPPSAILTPPSAIFTPASAAMTPTQTSQSSGTTQSLGDLASSNDEDDESSQSQQNIRTSTTHRKRLVRGDDMRTSSRSSANSFPEIICLDDDSD